MSTDKAARKCASKVLAIPVDEVPPDDTIVYGFKEGHNKGWNDAIDAAYKMTAKYQYDTQVSLLKELRNMKKP